MGIDTNSEKGISLFERPRVTDITTRATGIFKMKFNPFPLDAVKIISSWDENQGLN